MMLRERRLKLSWPQVAELFNIVFRNDRNEDPRTMKMLQQSMSRRKGDQKASWDTAEADPALRNRWQPAIDAAVRELRDNPNRAPITPDSAPNLQWDHERRLGLHLLISDRSVGVQERARIFNTIFQQFIASQGVQPLSATALAEQYRKEKVNAEERATKTGSASAKSKKYFKKTPTAEEDWQKILQVPQTTSDLATAADLKAKIEKLKKTTGNLPEEELSEEEEVEEEEASESEWEQWPDDQEEEPLAYDPNENVGNWAFVDDVGDGNQAAVNLGQQRAGMPQYPTANDVRRFRMQHERARRYESLTDGINIRRDPGQAANQPTTQPATQSAECSTDQPATQPVPQPAAIRTGHWRFQTDADEVRAIAHFGPGITAWRVRQRSLEERADRVYGGVAASINVHWVRNTDDSQPSEPQFDTSAAGLMLLSDAIKKSLTGPWYPAKKDPPPE
jgi:hypothetical protein